MTEKAELPLRKLRSCPLAIICGKPEEITTIAGRLGVDESIYGSAIEGIDNGHIFHLGKITLAGGKVLRFYVTSSLRQGPIPFAIAAGALITVLRPRFAIHAGVCAGNNDPKLGIELKHVIVGDSAISMEEGKWTCKEVDELDKEGKPTGNTTEELVFMPDYEIINTPVAGLIEFAASHADVHYGRYISGSSVRMDAPRIFKRIVATVSRSAIALEMEASAFLKLCSHSQHTAVQVLGVIKGVSDHGDSKKNKDVYTEALENTGDVVKKWIEHAFTSMTWEPNEDDEPGAKLARAYYRNYVQRLIDAAAQGMPVTRTDNGQEVTDVLPKLMVIMPPSNDASHYAEQGQIGSWVTSHRLTSVMVGRQGYGRTAYQKGDTLFDFPRTINDLVDNTEPSHQIEMFERHLKTCPFFKPGPDNDPPKAQILTWEAYRALLADMVERS